MNRAVACGKDLEQCRTLEEYSSHSSRCAGAQWHACAVAMWPAGCVCILAQQLKTVWHTVNLTWHSVCEDTAIGKTNIWVDMRLHFPRMSCSLHVQPLTHSARAQPIGLVPLLVNPKARTTSLSVS
jgi:hypothetical protein